MHNKLIALLCYWIRLAMTGAHTRAPVNFKTQVDGGKELRCEPYRSLLANLGRESALFYDDARKLET